MNISRKIVLGLLSVLFIFSCSTSPIIIEENIVKITPDKLSSQVAIDWMDLLVAIDREMTDLGPNGASRMIALSGMAIYESIVPASDKYKPLQELIPSFNSPDLNNENAYVWEAAVNTAMAELLRVIVPNISPKHLADIANLELKYNSQFNVQYDKNAILESIQWGRQVANSVIEYARKDAEAMSQMEDPRPSSYSPSTEPGAWRPTGSKPGKALYPYWGKVSAHIINKENFSAVAPPPYLESTNTTFYEQAELVYNSVKNATPTDRWIAEFWSDDLPEVTFSSASRMVAIANQLIAQEGISLEKSAELYCKLGIALSDAITVVWNEKYRYNLLRPTDYIVKMIDENYQSLLGRAVNQVGIVPDYPSYPSGHAAISAVGAGILSSFFGDNISFTDNCHKDRKEFFGNPRSFISLSEMANEQAKSRILLGIEYPFCVAEGQRLGREISQAINQNLILLR